MKHKAIVIGIFVVLLVVVAGIRYFANQSLVTPGSLMTLTEKSTAPADDSSVPPTGTPGLTTPAAKITLTITSPANGATVTSSSVKVQGKTLPNAEVFVNEKETKADKNGNFSVTMTLDEGENYMIVVANDELGNVAETELAITYSP